MLLRPFIDNRLSYGLVRRIYISVAIFCQRILIARILIAVSLDKVGLAFWCLELVMGAEKRKGITRTLYIAMKNEGARQSKVDYSIFAAKLLHVPAHLQFHEKIKPGSERFQFRHHFESHQERTLWNILIYGLVCRCASRNNPPGWCKKAGLSLFWFCPPAMPCNMDGSRLNIPGECCTTGNSWRWRNKPLPDEDLSE
jgi:hypothetical protein